MGHRDTSYDPHLHQSDAHPTIHYLTRSVCRAGGFVQVPDLGSNVVSLVLGLGPEWLLGVFGVNACVGPPKRFDLVCRLEASSGRRMAGQRDKIGAGIKRDPRFLWLWRMVAPPVAAVLLVRSRLELYTSVISVAGPGADYKGPAVYVNWHKYLPFLCVHHGQYRRWLLMSSAPYMEPIARWCSWLGLTVVRGAPGERSGEFLTALVEPLNRGKSVFLAVDGPAGPGFQVKRGCVELARAVGVPIIPVAYRSLKGKENQKRWDQLYSVGKFDRIEVRYGQPIVLDGSEPDSAALKRVQTGLAEVCSESWPTAKQMRLR